jgi:hypothetical protein
VSTRAEIAQAIARNIQRMGGSVTSLLPPRPGEALVYETRTLEQSNAISAWLRERGFRITALGTVARLVPDAIISHYPLTEYSSGPQQRVEHAGHTTLSAFEVHIPAVPTVTIPGSRSPPRPVRGPPIRRRRG